jgi:hypothetical protein
MAYVEVLVIDGRQIFCFWYFVYHSKKSVESLICLLEPCSIWKLLISFLVIWFLLLKLDMSLSMCLLVIFMLIGFCFVHLLNFGVNLVLIGFFDITWTTFSFHTFVWLLGLLGVLSKFHLCLDLESLMHALLLMYTLWHALLLLIQYIEETPSNLTSAKMCKKFKFISICTYLCWSLSYVL